MCCIILIKCLVFGRHQHTELYCYSDDLRWYEMTVSDVKDEVQLITE